MKKNYKMFLIIIIFILISSNSYAIGEIGVSLNFGISYDANNLSDEITKYNTEMEKYKNDNPGTSIVQLKIPYMPMFGINLRYQFNYILFSLGGNYSKIVGSEIRGKIKPQAGLENNISIKTYKANFPLTTALIIPLKKHTIFYFGAGFDLNITSLELTQTNTLLAIPELPTVNKESFKTYFVSYHTTIGAEIPLSNKFSISAEWISNFGYSEKTTSSESGKLKTFNSKGDIISFGIIYYMDI